MSDYREKTSFARRVSRRDAIKSALGAAIPLALPWKLLAAETMPASRPGVRIKDVLMEAGGVVVADDGTRGYFMGTSQPNHRANITKYLPQIRSLWVGRNPLDPALCGEMLWESIYPGKAQLYAEGRDPMTGEVILNTLRRERHTPTGAIFMVFSTMDIALWDLRGKLLQQPAYKILGPGNREKVLVYWRPGEADQGLADARRRARDAYDKGYHYQKWYFTKSAKDGEAGFRENVELVRVLREELPDAKLMFDNHSIRYDDNVEYSVRLCKAVAPYKPFWIEEPICPESLDGYAKIKETSGVTIAGGEHWYTRYPVKAFLDRKCVDYVQCDPEWCGGFTEWLKICDMVRQYPGVKVVPHITSPYLAAPHAVASQPESLCPLVEFNYEGGRKTLEGRMSRSASGDVYMAMPVAPGVS
jgi:L-alanine-DL-glutamate epimerase-like enolase superfamily enzyme